jgi:hypothetical protein
VKLVLEEGAERESRDIYVAKSGHEVVVKLLLAKGGEAGIATITKSYTGLFDAYLIVSNAREPHILLSRYDLISTRKICPLNASSKLSSSLRSLAPVPSRLPQLGKWPGEALCL